jgi:hypothetical protein
LKFPSETKFTQPDVLIESDGARVFIEVKVDAKVKLEQVQKYALLHATMNTEKTLFDVFDEASVSGMVEPV